MYLGRLFFHIAQIPGVYIITFISACIVPVAPEPSTAVKSNSNVSNGDVVALNNETLPRRPIVGVSQLMQAHKANRRLSVVV